jgi:hypothetical protein
LRRTTDTISLSSSFQKPQPSFTQNGITFYKKIKMSTIVSNANSTSATPYPLVDETNYDRYIDISIASDLSDLHALNNSLKKWGFEVLEAERELPVIIVEDLK